MSVGFPEATSSFLRGQDILYQQFNDVDFYVEDTGKEYFYYHILRRLLPGVKLTKIFPLGGKKNVVLEAKNNRRSKRKIYLVDLDFDDVLDRKQSVRNLVYLERYSIENYLFGKNAVYEQIREKTPGFSDADIASRFNYELVLRQIEDFLSQVAKAAIVIQRFQLGVTYYNPIKPDYDAFVRNGYSLPPRVSAFLTTVEKALKQKDGRYSIEAKIRQESRRVHGRRGRDYIPGKWILALMQSILRGKGLVVQKDLTSFSYSLAKDIDLNALSFLKVEIDRIRS